MGKAFSMYLSSYEPELPTLEDYPWHAIQHYYTYRRVEYPPKTGSFWCGLGCLYGTGLVENATAFYCPATEGWYEEYMEEITNHGKWGVVTGSDSFLKVRRGYVYWPLSKKCYADDDEWREFREKQDQDAVNYRVGFPRSPERQADLDRNKAIACDYTFHRLRGSGWNLNALFPDGHVVFQRQPRDSRGAGMVHTSGQFGPWPGGETVSVPIVEFMFALQP
jgi:hypothetical protein